MVMLTRIALGTAQFGLDYGLNNERGMVPASEVEKILDLAWNHGIDTIDTARAYGQSEGAIGNALAKNRFAFKIVTKLEPGREPEDSLRDSISHLGTSRVHGLLVHSHESYKKKPAVWDRLRELKAKGLADRIGFSLYHPGELDSLLAASVDLDIVQLPFSVFDRRFQPYFGTLQRMGVEIHVRSVFLQGLAFMDPATIPGFLSGAARQVRDLRALAATARTTVSSICLKFVLGQPEIGRVVIGVDSLGNLQENIRAASGEDLTPDMRKNADVLVIEDERVIVPSNWKR